jgi:hypothetical protein
MADAHCSAAFRFRLAALRGALVAGGLAVGLGAAALLAGHVLRVSPRADSYVYDPLLGWAPAHQSASSGPIDIAVVGDSFAAGEGVHPFESWPAVLGRRTGRLVYNAAVSAYGLDQMYLRATRLAPYRLLLIGVIPHDIYRCGLARFGAAKPYFVFDDGALALRGIPVPERGCSRLLDLWRATYTGGTKTGQNANEIGRALVRRFAELPGEKRLVLYSNDVESAPLRGLGVPVIDCGRIPFLLDEPGHHPSASGHRWIAECVAGSLR